MKRIIPGWARWTQILECVLELEFHKLVQSERERVGNFFISRTKYMF